jgi:hypothetical protein
MGFFACAGMQGLATLAALRMEDVVLSAGAG